MAFVSIQRGGGLTRESYEEVARRLDTDANPPDGLIVHTAGEVDGEWQVVDVWQSAAAKQQFDRERLLPAIEAMMTPETIDQQPPGATDYEAVYAIAP